MAFQREEALARARAPRNAAPAYGCVDPTRYHPRKRKRKKNLCATCSSNDLAGNAQARTKDTPSHKGNGRATNAHDVQLPDQRVSLDVTQLSRKRLHRPMGPRVSQSPVSHRSGVARPSFAAAVPARCYMLKTLRPAEAKDDLSRGAPRLPKPPRPGRPPPIRPPNWEPMGPPNAVGAEAALGAREAPSVCCIGPPPPRCPGPVCP